MDAAAMKTAGEHLLRELAPEVLGALGRRYDDFRAAEDAVLEALTAAALQWPRTACPKILARVLIQAAARSVTRTPRAPGEEHEAARQRAPLNAEEE